MHRKIIRFIRKIVWTWKLKILDKAFEAKYNVDLDTTDAKIDELNRSKFASNFKKDAENI